MRKITLKDIIIIILLIVILVLSIFLVKAHIDLKVKEQNIEMLKGQLEGKGASIYKDKIKTFEANFKILISIYANEVVKNDGYIENEDKLDNLKDECKKFKGKPIGAEYEINFYKRMICARLPYNNTEYVLKCDMDSMDVTSENPPEGAYDWKKKNQKA